MVVCLTLLLAFLASGKALSEELLLWSEEFDEPNLIKWNHAVTASRGGNFEFQYYRNNRKNSYVKNGILFIKPTLTADEYGEKFLYEGILQETDCNIEPCASVAGGDIVLPVLSARLESKFAFQYGRVEIRAKMAVGDWMWPAIWMLPQHDKYGSWPASGEIDLLELRANKHYFDQFQQSQGCNRATSTLHFGPDPLTDPYWKTNYHKSSANCYSDDFHIFGMLWTEFSITFTIDGEITGIVTPPRGGFWKFGEFDKLFPNRENIWQNGTVMAPFDKKFFIILNVAVGGFFFPNSWTNHPFLRPWNWTSPHPLRQFWEHRDWWLPTWSEEDSAMQVDYVRVYSL